MTCANSISDLDTFHFLSLALAILSRLFPNPNDINNQLLFLAPS
jgi:hypothetical protein